MLPHVKVQKHADSLIGFRHRFAQLDDGKRMIGQDAKSDVGELPDKLDSPPDVRPHQVVGQ